jgi:hypothetical protein
VRQRRDGGRASAPSSDNAGVMLGGGRQTSGAGASPKAGASFYRVQTGR